MILKVEFSASLSHLSGSIDSRFLFFKCFKKICINMNYILKTNSHYVCSREFNLSGSVSYSDIRDAALDEMVADFMAGE